MLIATGVGGPVGAMLVGAGVDTIIQKATTGKVDWGQVAIGGALGGFGGASVAAKAGLTGLKGTVVAGAASGGVSGAASGAYGYMRGPSPHTVMGAVGATATGAGAGALLGAGGSAVGHGIANKLGWLQARRLPSEEITPGPITQAEVNRRIGGLPRGTDVGKSSENRILIANDGGMPAAVLDFKHLTEGREVDISGEGLFERHLIRFMGAPLDNVGPVREESFKIVARAKRSDRRPTLQVSRPAGFKNIGSRYPND